MSSRRTRLHLMLPSDTHEQITKISKELNIPKSAVVSQAVARWLSTDPVFSSNNHHRQEEEDRPNG